MVRSHACDTTAREKDSYSSYFQGLKAVYGLNDDRVYKCYMDCGWPQQSTAISSDLPTLVVAVGLEASGQKMWLSSIFNSLVESDSTFCTSDVRSSDRVFDSVNRFVCCTTLRLKGHCTQ